MKYLEIGKDLINLTMRVIVIDMMRQKRMNNDLEKDIKSNIQFFAEILTHLTKKN